MNKYLIALTIFLLPIASNARNETDVEIEEFSRKVFNLSAPDRELTSKMIQAVLNINLTPVCRGPIPDSSGDYYACVFSPSKVREKGKKVFHFVEFSSASRKPRPDAGGDITWKVSRDGVCITKKMLADIFKTSPAFPRYPIIAEAFSEDNRQERETRYDLILHAYRPLKENVFLAVTEINGCAMQIKLYKNEIEKK